MKERINEMLVALKASEGLTVATIEKEIGVSGGTINKAAKGVRGLSDENFEKLEKFFKDKLDIKPAIEKQTVVTPKGKIKSVVSVEGQKMMRDTMDSLNKRFGAGTIMTFGEKPDTKYETISTGSFGLDNALGIGGLPRGRIVEIYGWESSGKTTIALNAIADAQRQGLKCLLVDAENAFDPEYAAILGVNVDELQYCQPSCGEEALETVDVMLQSGTIGLVVIDSVAALVPKAELSGEMGESKMGLHARLMSQACRKLVGLVAKSNTLVIFINQLRLKIGMVFGNPEVTTGGMALQFYASVRLEVRRSLSEKNAVMNGEVKEGNLTTVKVVKNKCAPPFRTSTFNIIYGQGINRTEEVLVAAIKGEVVKKTNKSISYGTIELGKNLEEAESFLNDNEETKKEIEVKTLSTPHTSMDKFQKTKSH